MPDPHRQQRLREFVTWCQEHLRGDEKGEAQVFLDRLFKAFGQPGCLEVGGRLETRVKSRDRGGTAFADYVWKPVVLIEMKKRGEDLARHLRQAFDYWVELAPNRPQYVVLCNFDTFAIYDLDQDIHVAQDTLALGELPDRYGPLNFLFPTHEAPQFKVNRGQVTRQAADLLATCYTKLKVRQDVGPDTAQRFVLQMLVALFSEDIGLLPKYFVTQLLNECTDPPKAFDLLTGLFTAMNTHGGVRGGRFKDVPYFNGGLFAQSAAVELAADEMAQLKQAATYNWADISPEIFGSIFQHSMNQQERHKFGGHYTTAADIMKIIKPTITDPWLAAIDRASSVADLRGLQQRLRSFRVLDPACGSGNFLFLAYRDLKRIEAELDRKLRDVAPARLQPGQRAFAFVTAKQLYGLDIVPFAVELAKVTLMLAPKLAIDELHTDEQALPLDNLDANVRVCDALIDDSGGLTPWPACDVIIGNPPFLGAKRLKPEHGADYVNRVRKAFPEVPGMADYCVYWVRRAHDHLPACTAEDPLRGRAGLVGTQNIRNNQSRVGGLDHVVNTGGVIVEAVDNQPWSGEANVHVSIVNWVKCNAGTTSRDATRPRPPGSRSDPASAEELLIPARRRLWSKVDASSPLYDGDPAAKGRKAVQIKGKRGKLRKDKSYELAAREVEHINSALSDQTNLSGARELVCNIMPQRVFQGVTPGYEGFVISPSQVIEFTAKAADVRKYVRPYVIGRELASGDGTVNRYLLDVDGLDALELAGTGAIYAHLQKHVLPAVRQKVVDAQEKNTDMVDARKEHLERWWTYWARRRELRTWMAGQQRVIASSRTQRWPFIFVFLSTTALPGDKLQLFAFSDDYSFALLNSCPHMAWYKAKAARLKNEADYNYSSRSVFDTFPWPQSPTKKQVDAVAEAGAGRGAGEDQGRAAGGVSHAGTAGEEPAQGCPCRVGRGGPQGLRLLGPQGPAGPTAGPEPRRGQADRRGRTRNRARRAPDLRRPGGTGDR